MQLAPTPYPLGRLAFEDPRSLAFPMSDYLPPLGAALPDAKYWQVGVPVDQGNTSSCVGYSIRNLLEATPSPVPAGAGPDGWAIYQKALELDHIPGNADTGTSLVAGAKAAQSLGYVTTYVWATTMYDLLRWVLLKGPVIIGSVWTDQMFRPDGQAVLHPTGAVAGGHAWMVYGADQRTGHFRMQNSWARWGSRGRAWIWYRDLESLVFARGGECLSATEP